MSVDPQLDALLRQYLADEIRERSQGYTRESMHRAIANLGDNLAAHIKEDERARGEFLAELKELKYRIGNVERDVQNVETTGEHLIEDLEQKLEAARARLEARERNELEQTRAQLAIVTTERRDSVVWWKRQRVIWIAAAIACVLSACTTACVGYVAAKALPAVLK